MCDAVTTCSLAIFWGAATQILLQFRWSGGHPFPFPPPNVHTIAEMTWKVVYIADHVFISDSGRKFLFFNTHYPQCWNQTRIFTATTSKNKSDTNLQWWAADNLQSLFLIHVVIVINIRARRSLDWLDGNSFKSGKDKWQRREMVRGDWTNLLAVNF